MANYCIVKELFLKSFFLTLLLCFFCVLPMLENKNPSISLPEDIVCNNLIVLLNLSQLRAFAATCKTYQKYCDIKNICESKQGKACFVSLVADYRKCTYILSWVARNHSKSMRENKGMKQDNTLMFDNLYSYHQEVRDSDLKRLNGDKQITEFSKKIDAYRKYYSPKNIKQHYKDQLRNAIYEKNYETLKIIALNYNENILQLFHKHSDRDQAFNALCAMSVSNKSSDILLALMPTLKAEKNLAMKYLFMHATDALLCDLCQNNFIIPTESDEYQSTPLHHAARLGFLQFTGILIARGAHLYARNRWYHEPLYYACRLQHREVVEQLHKAYDPQEMVSYIIRMVPQGNNIDEYQWIQCGYSTLRSKGPKLIK